MRLLKLLTTSELEKKINKKLEILKQNFNGNYEIKFKGNVSCGEDGIYVYATSQGYHYVVSERGTEKTHKITDDAFEISFWVIYPFVIKLSFDYELENRKDEDPRIVAFKKQIELLGMINDNFAKRGEIEQSEILKVNPLNV